MTTAWRPLPLVAHSVQREANRHEARSQEDRQLHRADPAQDLITKLNLQQGQWLHVTEMPDGGVRLTPYDPDFDKAMAIVDDIMDEDKDTLRALARWPSPAG